MGEKREMDRHPGTGQRALTLVLYTLREGFSPVNLGRNIPSREEQRGLQALRFPKAQCAGKGCWAGI